MRCRRPVRRGHRLGTDRALYEALGRLAPSPIVELNGAVASRWRWGLPLRSGWSTTWSPAGQLAASHLLPSVRGELLTRLGRTDEARAELTHALHLCGNTRERTVLERKLTEIG